MSRELNMCVVNPELIEVLRPLVGSQAEIMTCAGISWNSWTKIAAGTPVRLSVGMRLRARLLGELGKAASIRRRFACAETGELDREALERAFLTPVRVGGGQAQPRGGEAHDAVVAAAAVLLRPETGLRELANC